MANEIGKVHVRVRPDTSGFTDKIRRDLKRMKDQTYKVKVEVDAKLLRKQLDKQLAQLNKDLLAEENKLVIRATLDADRSEVTRARQEFQAMADEKDVEFNAKLKTRAKDFDIKPNVDTRELGKEIQGAVDKATKDVKLLGDDDTVKKNTQKQLSSFRDALGDWLKTKQLQFGIKVDQKDLDRAKSQLEKSYRELADAGGELEHLDRIWEKQNEYISKQARELGKMREEYDWMRRRGVGSQESWLRYTTNITDAAKNLARLEAGLHEIEDRRFAAQVGVEINERSVAEYEAQIAELEARSGFDVEIDANADTALAEAQLALVARDRVAKISARVTNRTLAAIRAVGSVSPVGWDKIGEVLGGFAARTTGIRLLWQTTKNIFDIVPKLDMMIPQLAQAVGAAVPVVSGIVAGVGSMVSILADSLKVAQGVLLAPAVASTYGIFSLILGSAFGKKQIGKFIPELVEQFKALKDVLGAGFWKGASKGFTQFLQKLLDFGKKDGAKIAESLGEAFSSFGKGMSKGLDESGARYFKNLDKLLKSSSKGLESLGHAFATLTAAGSDSFESIGKWFTGIMGDFDTWVTKNDKNGNITKWINEAGQALSDLGSIVFSVGSMIQSFGQIVKDAGGPGLSDFAAGMRELADVFKSPWFEDLALQPLAASFEFFNKLGTIKPQAIEAISTAVEMLSSAMMTLTDPVIGAIGAILDGFNSDNFGKGFSKFIQGIADFIRDVTPGLEVFVSEFGSLLGVVGTAASSFGPAFNSLLELIGAIGHDIHPGFEDFLKFIGPELQSFIDAISPGLEDIASAISDLLSNKDFQQFWSDVNDKLKIVVPVIEEVVAGLIRLVGAIFNGYSKLPDWMQDLVTWGTALGGVGLSIGRLVGPLGRLAAILATPILKAGLLGSLEGLVTLFKTGNILKGIGGFFAGFGKSLLNSLGKTKIGSALMRAVAGIAGVIKNTKVGQILGKAILRIFPKGGFLRLLLPRLVSFLGNPVVTIIGIAAMLIPADAPGQIIAGILDLLGLDGFADKFREALKEYFPDGKSLWDMAMDSWSDLFRDIGDLDFGGIAKDIANIVAGAPIGIAQAFMDAIGRAIYGDENWADMDTFRENLWGTVKGTFENIWQTVTDAVSDGWDYFLEWIDSWAPDWTFDFFKWLGDLVGDVFGSKSKGGGDQGGVTANLFGSSGASGIFSDIWSDLQGALDDGWDWFVEKVTSWKPVKTVFDFASKVSKWVKDLFGDSDGDGTINLFDKDYWGGVWDGIKKSMKDGWDGLVEKIKGWKPVKTAYRWAERLVGWVKELLGIGAGGGGDVGGYEWWVPITSSFSGMSTSILGALSGGWELLKSSILNWSPIQTTIDFLGKIWGWIKELLGLDGTFDFLTPISDAFTTVGDTVLGALDTAWEGLKSRVLGWGSGKSGNAGGGLNLSNLLGVDAGGLAGLQGGFAAAQGSVTGFTSNAGLSFGNLSSLIKEKMLGIKTDVSTNSAGARDSGIANFSTLGTSAAQKVIDLATTVGSNFSSMRSKASTETGSMKTKTSSDMTGMQSSAVRQLGIMVKQVNSQFAAMKSRAQSETGSMRSAVSAQMNQMPGQARSAATRLKDSFIAPMRAMQANAKSIASSTKSGVISNLRGNASGSGSYIGSTFKSGLSAAGRAAIGIARSIASSVKAALSTNAYSSGASIGSTFASGIRSKIAAAKAAAQRLIGSVKANLPHSPAKEGPMSGSGWGGWGESIGEEVAKGLKKATPLVAKEAANMMSGVSSALSGGSGLDVNANLSASGLRKSMAKEAVETAQSGYVAGGVTVNVETRSDKPFEEAVRFAKDLRFALEGM